MRSSTSNFEPNENERSPAAGFPLAAVTFLLAVVAIETLLWNRLEWFSDRAAWQWKVKKELMADGALDGDIALVGTSITFHSVNARKLNELTRDRSEKKVVNLALNGMPLNARAQMLADYFSSGRSYELVMLELPIVTVEEKDWIVGPYWRFWATWDEFAASRFYYYRPSLAVSFTTNRVLASYSFNTSLDNFIFECGKKRTLVTEYRDRNRRIAREMAADLGFDSGTFDVPLTPNTIPSPEPRPWTVNPAGELWLDKLLDTCDSKNVQVVIFQPPCPPFVAEQRAQAHYDEGFHLFVSKLRQRYPKLGLEIIEPPVYQLDDFADDHHLTPKGSRKLTATLAEWVAERFPQR